MTIYEYFTIKANLPRYFYFTQFEGDDSEVFVTIDNPEMVKSVLNFYDVYLGELSEDDAFEFVELLEPHRETMTLEKLEFLWNTYKQSRKNQSE